MTEIMSYDQAVLEIRKEVANRGHFLISGTSDDMIPAMIMLGERKCTVWMNSDFGQAGVFKIESSDAQDRHGVMSGVARLLQVFTAMMPVELGIVVAVPKVEGLPEKFPNVPGKDLICLNDSLPILFAEAMRTTWPDKTVLAPEETEKAVVA